MTSTYSFGVDSPLKFQIPDKMAQHYNEAVDQFFKAQQRFNQKFGRTWDPKNDAIEVSWSKKQRRAWNQFADVMRRELDKGVTYHANDIMDDFLVKNAVSAIAVGADRWGRAITISVVCGALYGRLRGL